MNKRHFTKHATMADLWAALFTLFWVVTAPVSLAAQDLPIEDSLLEHAQAPWKGDLDGMLKRGFIRVLTTYNPLFFTYDGAQQRGMTVAVSRELVKFLRKRFGKRARNLNVVHIPIPRDRLLPGLISGRGDIVVANLTITRERKSRVAFSNPFWPNVSELIVTGPAAKNVKTFDDLVAVGVHLRRSSSYFEHLSRLNEQRRRSGKKPIPVHPAEELLEDFDLLEMVSVGVIPSVIVDSHKVALWARVFKKIKVHKTLAVNTGGNIGWAVRKQSPQLLKALNGFKRVIRKGTLLGNVIIKRYMNTRWIDNAMKPKARNRFQSVIRILKKHSGQYGFDWLMIAAQGYQESKLDQSKRSKAGAVGVMQVMPSTAADRRVAIRDIHLIDNNIQAGVKYLKLLRDAYFDKENITPLDRVLFSFAAYNAGPGAISRARRKAKRMGFDPNRWFGHVEVAAARTISREPLVYVRNIYKYFITFKLLQKKLRSREIVKKKMLQR